MLNKRQITTTISSSIGIVLALASTASAIDFSGTTRATWGTPTPDNIFTQFSGVGTNTFTTGQSANLLPATTLTFTGNPFTTALDTIFKIGNLSYYNGETLLSSTVDTVPLQIQLGFTNPAGLSNTFNYRFAFDITSNSGDREASADRLIPLNTSATGNFVVDGISYTLQLGGFSQDGGATIVPNFKAYENESTQGAIYGKITQDVRVPPPAPVTPPTTVPEPGVVMGLLGIATMVGKAKTRSIAQ
jgi:hypothetical protein